MYCTNHAQTRIHQRNIDPAVIQLLDFFGEEGPRFGDRVALYLSRRAAEIAAKAGISGEVIERARTIVMIVGYDTNALITVMRTNPKRLIRRMRRRTYRS